MTVTGLHDMEISLASAALLARQGRYGEARVMLDELGGSASADPVLLDLLARVHAQRGDLAAADECWTRALEVGGDLPAARAGRRRIAVLRTRRHRTIARQVAGPVSFVIALAGVGAAGAYLASQGDRTDPAVLAELRDTRRTQDELARQFGDVRGALDHMTNRAKVIDELTAALDGSGMIVRRERDMLVITFPAGVFSTGTNLSGDGRQGLADLGQRLRRFGDLTITVVGHTDNGRIAAGGRYTNHVDLGLARARAAAEELSARGGLPLTGFALTSTGMAEPPFPNTTAENRARNRTVTIRVVPN